MLIVLYILFFSIVCSLVAYISDKEIAEILPPLFSAFVLVLYALAFLNRMWFIDVIVSAVTVVCAWIIFNKSKQERYKCLKKMLHPSVIVFICAVIIGVLLLSERGLFSDDDWNFWATDVKTLFYLQGFSPAGFNTVPLYGDYPPASQLIEAWLMHVFGGWNEGLLFSAYFLAVMVYTVPVLKNIPSGPVAVIISTVWMFLIYSTGPNMMFDISADILMGCVYGSIVLLAFYWNKRKKSDYIMLSLMLSVTVLMKSVGIQWALFAIVFIIISDRGFFRNCKNKYVFMLPVIIWLTWNIFCKTAQRTTYLTESLKDVASVGYDSTLLQQYGSDMVKSFFKAFTMPQQKSIFGVGFSIIVFWILAVVIIHIYKKYRLITGEESKYFTGFILLSGIVEYGILLFSVLTMFINETWYTQPEYMLVLLKRYSAPFIISLILIVNGVLFDRVKDNNKILFAGSKYKLSFRSTVVYAAIFLQIIFAPLEQEKEKYITYRGDTYKELITFNEAICHTDISVRNPELVEIVKTISEVRQNETDKILIIHDESEYGHNEGTRRKLRYYCAPDAVELVSVSEEIILEDLLENNNYTAICFATAQEDCSNFKDVYGSYKNIDPYRLYELQDIQLN